ncbi:uncharacterized protein At1g51745-like isoform X1 [Nymphaea colorata]|nr:uncharacterized protein At1g51745-like isoform X1 [Nymphaea colorata]
MGIPEGEAVDCGVGTIVWVRRRNGSWWPGRILGQDELSATHLMSPRSGTPVKLLGREDASVDWYNLEKSKRVKAFRCGEFDDCIRKAESSQGLPPKKREKYARREDAILHALELEKLQLERRPQKYPGVSMSEKRISMKKDLEHSFSLREEDCRVTARYMNIKSQSLSRKVGTSLNNEYRSPLATHKLKQANQLHWEDDNAETMPRMRGLQDFGLKIAPSKRANSTFAAYDGNRKASLSQNFIHSISPTIRGAGIANQISSKRSPLTTKKKRSLGGLSEESLVKRRDRRRTLVQVLQSSAKLPASQSSLSDVVSLPILRPEEAAEMSALASSAGGKIPSYTSMDSKSYFPDQTQASDPQFGMDKSLIYPSSLTEDGLMDDGESDSCEREDDGIEEDPAVLSDTSQVLPVPGSRNHGRYVGYGSSAFRVRGHPAKMSAEDLDDSGYSRYGSSSHRFEQHAANGVDGVSKWQLKGKRNTRNLGKRHMDIADEDFYEAEESVMSMNSRPWISQEALGGYWEESDECFDPRLYASELDPMYGNEYGQDGTFESMLVNVDLKVQASYQGEHVPLVSLMSRLNGKAIIGHPVQVEILEDGSSELLLADSGFRDDSSEKNESTPVPPVWRTARRTAMQRVPRSQPCAQENEESLIQCSPVECQPPVKKLNSGSTSHKSGSRKSSKHASRSKRLSKKLLKKASLSNKKTRTLSSFSSEQKAGKNGKLDESVGRVTTIPVKAVFDRLKDSFTVPSAHASAKKDLTTEPDGQKSIADS